MRRGIKQPSIIKANGNTRFFSFRNDLLYLSYRLSQRFFTQYMDTISDTVKRNRMVQMMRYGHNRTIYTFQHVLIIRRDVRYPKVTCQLSCSFAIGVDKDYSFEDDLMSRESGEMKGLGDGSTTDNYNGRRCTTRFLRKRVQPRRNAVGWRSCLPSSACRVGRLTPISEAARLMLPRFRCKAVIIVRRSASSRASRSENT